MQHPLKLTDFVTEVVVTTKQMKAFNPRFVLASLLVVGHESKGGTYWEQQGGGPALGVIQMEDWVHDDVWENCDNIQIYADNLGIKRDITQLKTSLRYNIFMMRCRFIMDVNPFPEGLYPMADYIKRYWNSEFGAASSEKYINDFVWWTTYDHSQPI